ncbi:MAG: hypothetical protein ACRD1V_19075 [Vicinamibacterales bacterium]
MAIAECRSTQWRLAIGDRRIGDWRFDWRMPAADSIVDCWPPIRLANVGCRFDWRLTRLQTRIERVSSNSHRQSAIGNRQPGILQSAICNLHRSAIGNLKSIANRQSVDQQSPIDNPSIANRQSAVANDDPAPPFRLGALLRGVAARDA